MYCGRNNLNLWQIEAELKEVLIVAFSFSVANILKMTSGRLYIPELLL